MSSADRLLLILHIGFAIFTLGPLTAATMATPRYIRRGEPGIVRYLNRVTRIYGLLTLGIFLFGALIKPDRLGRGWLSASMTLFVVAFVLLFIVERDQRKAIHRIEVAEAELRPAPGQAAVTPPEGTPARPETGQTTEGGAADTSAATTAADTGARATVPAPQPVPAAELAKVELGRIATISGVVALIWIVILVLMVWNA